MFISFTICLSCPLACFRIIEMPVLYRCDDGHVEQEKTLFRIVIRLLRIKEMKQQWYSDIEISICIYFFTVLFVTQQVSGLHGT